MKSSSLLLLVALLLHCFHADSYPVYYHFWGKINCPKNYLKYIVLLKEWDKSDFDYWRYGPVQEEILSYSYDITYSTTEHEDGDYYDLSLGIRHTCTSDGSEKLYEFLPKPQDGSGYIGYFNKWNNFSLEINFEDILNKDERVTFGSWDKENGRRR